MLAVCAIVTIPEDGYRFNERQQGMGTLLYNQRQHTPPCPFAKVQVPFLIASRGSECSALGNMWIAAQIRMLGSQLWPT